MKKEYRVIKLPEIDLEKIVAWGARKYCLKTFWYVDYSPWLMYKNAFFEDSLGVVLHFVIGDK